MSMIFRSLFVIAAVAAIAGGATFAYFSDTATLSGSTFSAGTLDLKLDSNPARNGELWKDNFNAPSNYLKELKPGFSDDQIIDIKKVGSVDGYATIKFQRTSAWSDLANNLNFVVYFDADHSGDFEKTVASGPLSAWNGNVYTLGEITSADGIASVKIAWSVPASAGNEIQGDKVTIDTTFGLEQVR